MAITPNEQFDDELLSAYLDDELDAASRAAVDDRLRTDERARRLLAELRQASEAVKALPRATLGRDLRGGVLAAIEKSAIEPATIPMGGDNGVARSSGRGWAWAGLAVAIAASVMVVAVIPTRLRNEDATTAPQVADASKAPEEREVEAAGEAPTSTATEMTDGEADDAPPTVEPATAAGKTNDAQRTVRAATAPAAATSEPSSLMTKGAVPPPPAAVPGAADEAAAADILNVQVVDENDAARFHEILAENRIDVSESQLPADVTALLVEAVDGDDSAAEAVLVEATPRQLAAIRQALAGLADDEASNAAGTEGAQEPVDAIRGRAWRLPGRQAAADQAVSLNSATADGARQGEVGEASREGLVRALFLLKRPR
jgi:anti-sigma factor RsiW